MKRSLVLTVALLLGSGAVFAAAPSKTPPPPPPASEAPPPDAADGGPQRHWRGPEHHRPALPILRALHGLNLSDEQRDHVRKILISHRGDLEQFRARHRAVLFDIATLDPTAANYRQQAAALADQAGALARDAVQAQAAVTAEIVAVLTPEQTQQLHQRLTEFRQHGLEREYEHAHEQGPPL